MILCKQKTVFFLILIFLLSSKIFGQDAHYSQFYANPLYLNPAFAGSNNCPRFSINFRDQWPAIPGNFLVLSGSYDQHIAAIRSGIGVIVLSDIQGKGMLNTFNASAIYNFRIKVSHKFNLQFALQGGYLTSYVNWSKMETASGMHYEDLSSFSYKEKRGFDAAFGIVGYTPYLYFGIAMHHLFPIQDKLLSGPGEQFKTNWVPKYTAHIGGKITILQKSRNEVNVGDIYLYPNFIFSSQGTFNYMHEGFYFNFYPFTIGGWLRHNFNNVDAFIFSCGVEYKFLRVGYSYDFILNKLEGTGGAHEVSLQFTIPCNNDRVVKKKTKKSMNYEPLDCPKF